jgi:hypothetical protein
VGDVERGAPKQRVTGLPVVHLDPDPAPPEGEAESQAVQPPREPGAKARKPSWSRIPPKPATAAIQAPASEAR